MKAHTWRKLVVDIDAPSCIPAHHWACEVCDCTISSDVDGAELKWGTMRDNCYGPGELHPEWRACRHLCWVFADDANVFGKCFDCGWRSSFNEYLAFVKAGRKAASSAGKGGE